MVFCSPVFLFLFLPVVLTAYFVLGRSARNLLLLAASVFFYAWGEKQYVVVLLASITLNYVLGLVLDRVRAGRPAHLTMALAIIVNLGLLGAFKYANFLADNLNVLLEWAHVPPVRLGPVHLPLGISFFTFHALSYVIDVYRREVRALHNPIDFALYISFFPQAIAGPIVRYHDVAEQLGGRAVTLERFAEGVRRFVLGLAKKMLIANSMAVPADAIFGLPTGELSPALAWLGALCYTLQIYFDFSGYSDMAIGLAKLFGFEFLENFNYPYVARSVTEFWRRWHISLSSWYRDYLYIPLGGNRGSPARTYFNLVTVFFLCGLWHGASWTFIIWGFYHGVFLMVERMGLGKRLETAWAPLRHLYALLAVVVGWVLFRAVTLGQALAFLGAMAGLTGGAATAPSVAAYLNVEVLVMLVAGALASLPLLPWLARWQEGLRTAAAGRPVGWAVETACAFAPLAVLALFFVASAMLLAAGTYNPFIYFRF